MGSGYYVRNEDIKAKYKHTFRYSALSGELFAALKTLKLATDLTNDDNTKTLSDPSRCKKVQLKPNQPLGV